MKPKTRVQMVAEITADYRLGVNTADEIMSTAESVCYAAIAVRDKAWRDFHITYDKLNADRLAALKKLETAK